MDTSPSLVNYCGPIVRSAGWYGHTKGLHTIFISVANFQGLLYIEASQMINPTDSDWFSIPYPSPFNQTPYISYPRIGAGYIIDPNNNASGETSQWGFNFQVNCLWLRARFDRTNLLPAFIAYNNMGSSWQQPVAYLGKVIQILVNY